MRITAKKYTWADATEFGYAPDERCDWCGAEFKKEPVKNQTLCGFSSVCCSRECSHKFWDNRRNKKSFRSRFEKAANELGYKLARMHTLGVCICKPGLSQTECWTIKTLDIYAYTHGKQEFECPCQCHIQE